MAPARRLLAAATLLLVAACSTNDGRTMKEPAPGQSESVAIAPTTVAGGATFTVTPPWSEGALIDPRHTCDNLNVSPAVSWANPPEGTASFAVILTDLDAPEYAHWTVANIDAASTGISEGSVGDLAVVAMNSDAKPDYAGPCPPEGETHRYSLGVRGEPGARGPDGRRCTVVARGDRGRRTRGRLHRVHLHAMTPG